MEYAYGSPHPDELMVARAECNDELIIERENVNVLTQSIQKMQSICQLNFMLNLCQLHFLN